MSAVVNAFRNPDVAAAYRSLIGARLVLISFATVTELRYGALKAGWGELRQREPLVIQERVEVGELTRQDPHPRRQQQLEQRTLRTYSAQRRGLQTLVPEGTGAIVPNTRALTRDASPQLPGYFRGK